jgi:hypothetical protein
MPGDELDTSIDNSETDATLTDETGTDAGTEVGTETDAESEQSGTSEQSGEQNDTQTGETAEGADKAPVSLDPEVRAALLALSRGGGQGGQGGNQAGTRQATEQAQTKSIAERIAGIDKITEGLRARGYEELAEPLAPVITAIKELAADLAKIDPSRIDRFDRTAQNFEAQQAAEYDRTVNGMFDTIAGDGYEKALGKAGAVDGGQRAMREAIHGHAVLLMQAYAQSGKPITGERALRMATQIELGGAATKAEAVRKVETQVTKRHGMRMVPPKATGAAPIKSSKKYEELPPEQREGAATVRQYLDAIKS